MGTVRRGPGRPGIQRSDREDEAKLVGKTFKPAIEPPTCWRAWAAKSEAITGNELLAFINNEELKLSNGKRGAGLFV